MRDLDFLVVFVLVLFFFFVAIQRSETGHGGERVQANSGAEKKKLRRLRTTLGQRAEQIFYFTTLIVQKSSDKWG